MKIDFDIYTDAINLIKEDKNGKFPYDKIPGTTIEDGNFYFNVGEDEATWNAYEWNPPQYTKLNVIYDWSRWIDIEEITEKPQDDLMFERMYMVSATNPGLPEDRIQTSFYNGKKEKRHYPSGWSLDWPNQKCWVIKRALLRVPQDKAITQPDADAMEKPTWEEMDKAIKTVHIINDHKAIDQKWWHAVEHRDRIRRDITDNSLIAHSLGRTYVGEGLDHMTGILQAVEQSTQGGQILGPIILRDDQHVSKSLWLQGQARDLLNEVARRENVTESAHNKIIKPIKDAWAQASDESKEWIDRLEHINTYDDLMENYQVNLKAEIAKYDPNALPDDLPTLKKVYEERIEGHALGHAKTMRGVLTQQGIDLPPSCNDEANALQKVSVESVKGHILVNIATTKEEAKTAYDNALSAISSVWPLNTPLWIIEGTQYDARPASPIDITGTSITIEAYHPSALDAANNEDIVKADIFSLAQKIVDDVPGSIGLALTSRTATNPKAGKATYTPQSVSSGDLIRFVFQSRNLCGPSEITVNLTIA